jgi:hypothetical protein
MQVVKMARGINRLSCTISIDTALQQAVQSNGIHSFSLANVVLSVCDGKPLRYECTQAGASEMLAITAEPSSVLLVIPYSFPAVEQPSSTTTVVISYATNASTAHCQPYF